LTYIKPCTQVTKRVTQLTGLYISDPSLSSADTLGDLFHHFCVAAKPKLAKVHKFIQVEGSKENHKANQLAQSQDASAKPQKTRAHVGDLLKLGNVKVLRKRPTAADERKKTGLHKAIRRELKNRNLVRRKPVSREGRSGRLYETTLSGGKTTVIGGTRIGPQVGNVVPREAAHLLKTRTERKKREWLDVRL
jgi:hypothetical protein